MGAPNILKEIQKPIEAKIADSYIFRGLSSFQLSLVSSIATEETFAKGDTIIALGCMNQDIYIVTSGWVNVNFRGRRRSDDGAPSTKLMIGGVIGEWSFVSDMARSATVVAEKSVTVARIDSKKLSLLFEKEPSIGYIVMRNIARKMITG